MRTRAKGGGDYARTEGRDDASIQQAGINAVFAELREMGPQFLRLQEGLIGGVARSQEREVKRLAAEDEKDPLVGAAEGRAERARALGGELASLREAARRLAEGFSQGGMFHGYVVDAQGQPAAGYIVQVNGASEATSGRKAMKAKTDETGYFRIEFDRPARKGRKAAEVVEIDAKADSAKANANLEPEEPGDSRAQYDGEAVQVDISSPAKKVVLRDPDPPAFDDPASTIFRFYPLIDLKSAARGSWSTGSPGAAR